MKYAKTSCLLLSTLLACQSTNTPGPSEGTKVQTNTSTQSQAWRKAVPQPGPEPQPQLPVFQRGKLKNGMTIMVAEDRALPLLSMRVVIRGGSSADPQDAPGLSSFAYGLLDEGAGDRDVLAFSDALADFGLSFSSGANQDSGWVSVSGLSRNRETMMGLMADSILKPQLNKADFERVQKQTIAGLMQRRGSPSGLAFEYVPGLLYGKDHPYGHPATGTVESVEKFTLSRVRRHLPKILTPWRACLIVSGDINLEEATKMAEKFLGKWKGTRRPSPKPRALEATTRSKITLIHKANSPQTMVILFRPIFGQGDPADAPLTVTNQIYGGSFASRLNLFLREEKGYTYGARSTLSTRRNVGAYLAYAKIKQDKTALGLQAFFDEMSGMKEKPPSSEEINRAKNGLIRSLTGQFESINAAAGAAVSLFIYGLPLDYYAQLPATYAGVQESAVKKAIEDYLIGEVFNVVLVGDAEKIQAEVKKLKLGDVKLITP